MPIEIIKAGSVRSGEDPNWGGRSLGEGEAFVAGNYGTLVFNVETGDVLRYYVSEEGPEYADITRIDVSKYVNRLGNPMQAGDNEDIIYVGFWTEDGTYCAAIDPVAEYKDSVNESLKRMFGIDLNDTGFEDKDVAKWYRDGEDPDQVAKDIAEDSDLQRIDLDRPYGGY